MSITITSPIDPTVVNVGDEVTTDQLLAIQNSVNASSVNPFATLADVGGGSYLPLAGGTMTGDITFGTAGQYIGEGNFDTSRGGVNGLSLVCSVGYEFNWQAGWLTTTEQNSTTGRPLYLDGLAGTTLRVWDSNRDAGSELTPQSLSILAPITGEIHPAEIFIGEDVMNGGGVLTFFNLNDYTSARYGSSGIVFPDGSFQGTAAGNTGQAINLADYNYTYIPTSGGDYIYGEIVLGGTIVDLTNPPTGSSVTIANSSASTDAISVITDSTPAINYVGNGTFAGGVNAGEKLTAIKVAYGVVHLV